MASGRSTRPWLRVRDRVIRRDKGICHLCGQSGADTADHLVPVAHGGQVYATSNLKAAHDQPCNRIRGTRSVTWAQAEIRRRWTELFGTPSPHDDTQGWTW